MTEDGIGLVRTILIAERDRNVRDLERHFLESAGYTVEFADDGQAALSRARTTLPQLVITEIMIPKLDGLQLCRELKQDPTTRVISVIVFPVLAAEARAREAGADAFLRKPLVPSVLLGAIERLGTVERLPAPKPLSVMEPR